MISVLTPTCDRPEGIRLAERWVAHQSRQPDEWIVGDGGSEGAKLTMGQHHVRSPYAPGVENFRRNLIHAARRATGDVLIVFEDDDYYGPGHIEDCMTRIEAGAHVVGSIQQRYYNVASRTWRVFRNRGSCMAQTAFVRGLLPLLEVAVERSRSEDVIGVDARFWERCDPARKDNFEEAGHVCGIKGLPGQKGLGVGHRPDGRWHPDPGLRKLREWIGDDADLYGSYVNP